uniref:Receptor ligand binding region domain-containing protein n=1 Tax=Graphocephala atropunctata TaxID=36148 RepID=A0A1B6MMP7_9HEMI
MTNVLWLLVLGGLWVERVAGGAVLERFQERLTQGRSMGGRLVEYREGGEDRSNVRTKTHRLVEFRLSEEDKRDAERKGANGPYSFERSNGGEPKEEVLDPLSVRNEERTYSEAKERGRVIMTEEVEKEDPNSRPMGRSKSRKDEIHIKRIRDHRRGNTEYSNLKMEDQMINNLRFEETAGRNRFQKDFDMETAFTESGNLLEFRARKDHIPSETTETPNQRRKDLLWSRDDELSGARAVLSDQATECVQAPRDDSTIHAAVILPNSTEYIMALPRVMPVLKLAMEEVRRRQLLPKDLNFQFLPWDDRCDAVYAQIATFEAVKKDVHVFFGPACEYSVAPVARMIKFWGKPLLTTGALTFDFSRDKRTPDSEYHLLLRAGLLSYRDLAFFLIALLDQYGWGKVMLVYDKDGCRHISGKHTCKLMMETLVEFFKREGVNYGSYDMEKNAADGLLVNLRRELGYQYNS